MKKFSFALLLMGFVALGGLALAQDQVTANDKIAGVRSMTVDVNGNQINGSRAANLIWNNMAITAWFGVGEGDIYLDWGELQPRGLGGGLVDHVIDGFTFTYASNNMDPAGESFDIYYFDDCDGWGNIGVQEAGFAFDGLPNGYGLASLPPGYAWIFTINVDLEGSGDEFLLNDTFGQGYSLAANPTMGSTGIVLGDAPGNGGNGPTGTDNLFDWYDSTFNYLGTYYFGPYPPIWATWPGELYGDQDPATNMMYYTGTPANHMGLYTIGDFSVGNTVRFLMKRNGQAGSMRMGVCLTPVNWYNSVYDATRLIGLPLVANSTICFLPTTGDFGYYDGVVPPEAAGIDVYFQSVVYLYTDMGGLIEAHPSNGIKGSAP
jgi:hypothetical protein